MARLILTLALAAIIFQFTLGEMLQKHGPELAKNVLALDEKQMQQLQSAEKRVARTANKMIAQDLITQTPVSQLVDALSEETRKYLVDHPEALPDVLSNYAGTIDMALKFGPQLKQIFDQFRGQAPAQEKFDY